MIETFDIYSYLEVSEGRAYEKRAEAKKQGIHVPKFLYADIAERCNLSCPGCYRAVEHTEYRERLLNVTEWDSLFREAEQLGIRYIFLTGGEPLLRRDILERAARYSDVWFLVLTNGTLLDEQYYRFFSEHRNMIPMLCKEVCSDVDLSMNGRSSALYGRLRQAMDELSRREIIYGATVALTSANYQRVLSRGFLGDLRRRNCKGVIYVEYGLSGAERRNLMLEGEVRDRVEEEIHILQEEFRDIVLFTFPREGRESEKDFTGKEKVFQVTVDGYVCPRLYRNIFGENLKQLPLREILKKDLFGDVFV